MPAARWTGALVGALATACLLAAPAFADSCGKPGYSYAGVVTQKRTAGVQAMITAPVAPQVQSGDVSGWIGVGRVGVSGKRGVVRVGLLAQTDGRMQLYYEVRRNGGWVRHLGPQVQPGERHFVKVVRSRRNAKRWRVLIDGNTVGRSLRLGNDSKWLRAVATAESWDGGARSCNQFRYAFGKVKIRNGRGWRRVDTHRPVQDPGYKVLNQHKARFLATNVSVSTDPSDRVFAGDWETGDASQWSGNHWNRNVPLSDQFAIVSNRVRQGRFAAKFTVRPGDKFGATSGERSEVLYTGANEVEGDDVWYAWSTLFPSDWITPTGWSIFTQWHSSYPVSPPISFNMKGERIQVNFNTGAVDSGSATVKPVYPITAALERGVWNDFVVHIVWSSTSGSIQVWHRTGSNPFALKVDAAGVPTMQTLGGVVSNNYLKIGFYRNDEPNLTNVVYQDGFSRATTPQALAPAFGGDPSFQTLLHEISPPAPA
ncbi:MAG TPA: polysaccharide lyase [Candidatus Eisenbacteria bacterium]|nr:polysaccharide lyase [Candidatus Eisenbacteria bacterium]